MKKNKVFLLVIAMFSAVAMASGGINNPKRVNQIIVSPDGEQAAFVTFQVSPILIFNKQRKYGLYLKNHEGKASLLDKSSKISSVTWSPDGKKIAYLADGDHFQSLWLQDIQYHQKKKLVESDADIIAFKWSPNGKTIAFVQGSIMRLYLTPSAGSAISVALTPENYRVSPIFTYSPDSRKIAFAYQLRSGDGNGDESKIGILNLMTHKIKTIPHYMGVQPTYSPNGKWIAFKMRDHNAMMDGMICVTHTRTLVSHCLAASTLNGNPTILGWDQTSQHVFVVDAYKTEGAKIYELNLNSAVPAKVVSDVRDFSGRIKNLVSRYFLFKV